MPVFHGLIWLVFHTAVCPWEQANAQTFNEDCLLYIIIKENKTVVLNWQHLFLVWGSLLLVVTGATPLASGNLHQSQEK